MKNRKILVFGSSGFLGEMGLDMMGSMNYYQDIILNIFLLQLMGVIKKEKMKGL